MMETRKTQTLAQKILVLHGPNLNLLGSREPQHYGRETLESINQHLTEHAMAQGVVLDTYQSNAEHQLIERVHRCLDDGTGFIILNPAGFTHTSIALRDALIAVKLPFIEVHLSNVHARESFRQTSYFSDIATGVVTGLGSYGYELALHYVLRLIGTH